MSWPVLNISATNTKRCIKASDTTMNLVATVDSWRTAHMKCVIDNLGRAQILCLFFQCKLMLNGWRAVANSQNRFWLEDTIWATGTRGVRLDGFRRANSALVCQRAIANVMQTISVISFFLHYNLTNGTKKNFRRHHNTACFIRAI
jgi:hypothetical protein